MLRNHELLVQVSVLLVRNCSEQNGSLLFGTRYRRIPPAQRVRLASPEPCIRASALVHFRPDHASAPSAHIEAARQVQMAFWRGNRNHRCSGLASSSQLLQPSGCERSGQASAPWYEPVRGARIDGCHPGLPAYSDRYTPETVPVGLQTYVLSTTRFARSLPSPWIPRRSV